jgi:serine/threonine-protein kinase
VLLALLLGGGAAGAYLLTRPVEKVVPDVVSQNISNATTILQNGGFRQSVVYVPDPKPNGTVISQNPLGGTKANDGATVALKVSQGPGNTPVPSVVGLSEAQARAQIRQAQLKVARVQLEPSNQIAQGDATRTEPAAGQLEPVGTPITLFVSSGPAPVTIPDVTGQSQDSAIATLRGAGFSVTTSTQESSTATPGTVLSQSPTGQAPPHSAVNLVIAKAPSTAAVPNVIGSKTSDATAALKAAGFSVRESTRTVTSQSDDGVVLSENPAAGKNAPTGSAVTIVVGKYKAPTPTTPTTPTTTTPTTSTPPTTGP